MYNIKQFVPMARRKRFNSKRNAISFAKKVNGKVNDLTDIKEAKSPYTVTYKPNEKTRKHGQVRFYKPVFEPEANRDFGYPNEYFK